MMLVFPTLNSAVYEDFTDDCLVSDIVSESDGGYKVTRPRNTRSPGVWTVAYQMLSTDDYQSFMQFYKTVRTSEVFTWTHPTFNTTHSVRFTNKPPFRPVRPGWWTGTYTVEEV